MVLNDLKIIFDNSQNAFFSGQTVSGRLVVQLDAPEYLHSVLVKIRGEANCSWNETRTIRRNGNDEVETTTYKDNDLYFENHVTLFGGSGNTEVLPAGSHFFQFSMLLPDHLPASFEGKYGHIRYAVKGILHRPWQYDNEVMAVFMVMPKLDLNLDPLNRVPVQLEETKYFCCCCCRSGPLSYMAYLPAKGYVPGQDIPVTIEIENGSDVKVREVTCELLKIVSYHCTSPRGSKEESMVVAELKFQGPVAGHESKTWSANMRIPSVPASMLQSCSIIDITYKLIMKAVLKGLHADLVHRISIIIGTVPLSQSTCPQQALPPPSAPPAPGAPVAAYTDMLLPTYEECMNSTSAYGDSQHMHGAVGHTSHCPPDAMQPTQPGSPAATWASFK